MLCLRGGGCGANGASVVQAAQYDVFVTQPPDQDPERCFQRNAHDRTRADVAEAALLHEPLPPSLRTVDCAAVAGAPGGAVAPPLPGAAPATALPDLKRKASGDVSGSGGGGGGSANSKRARESAAGGDSGSEMDTGEAPVDSTSAARAPRSRWADDDDDDDDGEDDDEEQGPTRWGRGAGTQVRSKQRPPEVPGAPTSIGARPLRVLRLLCLLVSRPTSVPYAETRVWQPRFWQQLGHVSPKTMSCSTGSGAAAHHCWRCGCGRAARWR